MSLIPNRDERDPRRPQAKARPPVLRPDAPPTWWARVVAWLRQLWRARR